VLLLVMTITIVSLGMNRRNFLPSLTPSNLRFASVAWQSLSF